MYEEWGTQCEYALYILSLDTQLSLHCCKISERKRSLKDFVIRKQVLKKPYTVVCKYMQSLKVVIILARMWGKLAVYSNMPNLYVCVQSYMYIVKSVMH